jgi:putative transposase
VTVHTVDGLDAFVVDEEVELLLRLVGIVTRRHGWTCIGYCVMSNHYHLVVHVPDDTLARGMHTINSVFAREFNGPRKRRGHVFMERYRSKLVASDSHVLEVCRYVDLNPVRASICVDPAQWRWSSFRALAGLARAPEFLDVGAALALFGRTIEAGRAAYVRFVYDGIGER